VNILLLHSSSDFYGSGYVIYNLLKYLKKQQNNSIVVLPNEGELSTELRKIDIEVIIYDFPVLRREYLNFLGVLSFLIKMVLSIFYIAKIINKHKINIIHTNTSAIWTGGIIASLKRKKHIWQVMEIIEKPKLVQILMSKMVGIFSDRVFCISEAVKNHFLKYNKKRADKFSTLYPGVDLEQYNPDKVSGEEKRYKIGIDSDCVLVTFAGRINSWKGYDVFVSSIPSVVQSLPKTDKVHFLILGSCYPGQEDYMIDLKKRISDIPNNGTFITCLGFQDDFEAWLAATDIFVLPSKQPEPNATVVIAAMAMKIPVIGTDIGGTPETIVENETGYLIPPNNHKILSDRIIRLVKNPKNRLEFGVNGHARILDKFSMSNYCQKLFESYGE
jgi:glycosyltransferase involved in cell wall biosynthesis